MLYIYTIEYSSVINRSKLWQLQTWERGFPGGSVVKVLPANAEGAGDAVWFLGWEDLCSRKWQPTLESHLDCKEVNQSIWKEISPEFSLKGLLLKLKLQYFGHLMWKVNSLAKIWCWERLKAKGEGGGGRWIYWIAITELTDMNLNKVWEMAEDREAWHAAVHGVTKSQTWLRD